jgi:hypothetical protein
MKVDIIVDESNKGWIIEKMANRLNENLLLLGIDSSVTDKPSIQPDVIHWMHYLNVPTDLKISAINTMLVTHVDEIDKLERLGFLIKMGVYPLFLSEAHSLEISNLLKVEKKFQKILPGSDLAVFNKIKFIINSNSYPDNRKNDDYLIKLSKDLNLEQTIFVFCGKRWEKVGNHLSDSGAEVYIYSKQAGNYPDYDTLNKITKDSDIFIYMGFDEGSIGALDAYLLNKKLIVSDQGFHKEMLNNDVLLFKNYDKFKELVEVEIANHLYWQKEKSRWSWATFAECHLDVWKKLSQNTDLPFSTPSKLGHNSKIVRLQRILKLSLNYNNRTLLLSTLKRLKYSKFMSFLKKGDTN